MTKERKGVHASKEEAKTSIFSVSFSFDSNQFPRKKEELEHSLMDDDIDITIEERLDDEKDRKNSI